VGGGGFVAICYLRRGETTRGFVCGGGGEGNLPARRAGGELDHRVHTKWKWLISGVHSIMM
jgi:hypothetical protein